MVKNNKHEEKIIELLKLIVPNQTTMYKDSEDNVWTGEVIEMLEFDLAITLIKKGNELRAKFIYDYASNREFRFDLT